MSASAPGSVPSNHAARPLRAIPRSRAYWELKAEQMMNRIFDPEEAIDLAVEPAAAAHEPPSPAPAAAPQVPSPPRPALAVVPGAVGASGPAAVASSRWTAATAAVPAGPAAPAAAPATAASVPPAASSRRPRPAARLPLANPAPAQPLGGRLRRPDERMLLIGTLCGVCLASVVGSLLYFGHWTRLQQAIAQERNLLLLERLRSLGPANPSPVSGPEPAPPTLPAPAAQIAAGAEGLPPPPPQEAWIEQLSTLPQAAPSPSRVLTVPVSPRLAAPAPAARGGTTSVPAPAPAPLPQLVGVVAGAGRAPSAIFLVGGSSMSVASGEQIGSTGWRLRSAEGETALIERGSELRQVSIASGNGF